MITPINEMIKEKKFKKNVDSNTSITIKNGNTTPSKTSRKPMNINRVGVINFIRTTNNGQSDL